MPGNWHIGNRRSNPFSWDTAMGAVCCFLLWEFSTSSSPQWPSNSYGELHGGQVIYMC